MFKERAADLDVGGLIEGVERLEGGFEFGCGHWATTSARILVARVMSSMRLNSAGLWLIPPSAGDEEHGGGEERGEDGGSRGAAPLATLGMFLMPRWAAARRR